MNPFSDTVKFLVRPEWPTYVFWVLLFAAGVAALANLIVDARQRSVKSIWMFLARILLASMWWQQSLWKIPPHYSGLKNWMTRMVQYSALGIQRSFVKNIVLPHLSIFAPVVYGIEVLIAVSLILGIYVRFGATLGALMAINLWLGLYSSPAEWPWTYFFLILLQVTFAVLPTGRSLGIDALRGRKLDG